MASRQGEISLMRGLCRIAAAAKGEKQFQELCYFYSLEAPVTEPGGQGQDGGPGARGGCKVRPLTTDDADVVDATWKYRDQTSLERIQAHISCRLSAGVQVDEGTLAAWALEQSYGAIGMLYTRAEFRRRGLAKMVVQSLARTMMADLAAGVRSVPAFAYIGLHPRRTRNALCCFVRNQGALCL